MPRHARLSAVLALLLLALAIPTVRASDPTTLAFTDGAPVLTGAPHQSTIAQPWSGIALSWTATSAATGYQVWRKGPLDADFAVLPPATGTVDLFYADSAVQPFATYSYYVVPITPLQVYLPSNVVTVTAPTLTPADETAPVVVITAPVAGARVSGTVRVTASAIDTVGVTGMELRGPDGSLLRSVAGSSLAYDWNVKRLKRGSSQTLTVRAFDAAGNVGVARVTVTIR